MIDFFVGPAAAPAAASAAAPGGKRDVSPFQEAQLLWQAAASGVVSVRSFAFERLGGLAQDFGARSGLVQPPPTPPRLRSICTTVRASAQRGDEQDADGERRGPPRRGSLLLSRFTFTGQQWLGAQLGGLKTPEGRANALGALLSMLAPLGGAGAGAFETGGVAAASVPIACPFFCGGDDWSKVQANLELPSLPTVGLDEYQSCLAALTLGQGLLGAARVGCGDVFTGFYGLLLAMVGFNSRHPGPAVGWLKTYVLITFINATMGGIDLMQHMLIGDFPQLLAVLPLKVNLMHFVQMSAPSVSMIAAYVGWQHCQLQRRMAMDNYQQQLRMMQAAEYDQDPGLPSLLPRLAGALPQGLSEIPQPPPGMPPLIPPHLFVPPSSTS